MSLAYEAMMFAREVHKDQRRKYTNEPYIGHLAEVAGIVAASECCTAHAYRLAGRSEAIAVAWLHDTVEDCGITVTYLNDRFGFEVANAVRALSDLEPGNRAERKAFARQRLAQADGWIQTIKCADLISNTSSIVQHDPKFAVTYLEEKRLLLDVLTKADPRLLKIAREQSAGSHTEGRGNG